MTVLITGGAGYIGSHMVFELLDSGQIPVVIDNLSTGKRSVIPDNVPFIEGDIGNATLVEQIIKDHDVNKVMHFAGSIVVPESVINPLLYYHNNTVKSHSLISNCIKNGVKNFVFSSTAAVYGIPEVNPVVEDTPTSPISPYGYSKLMTEWMLRDIAAAHESFSYIALRYFNVAGADAKGRTGQSTPEATHLIKVACQVALEQRPLIEIFGDDYNTKDGTCIRDYIHVADLVNAHSMALQYLENAGRSLVLNCGYSHGSSVKDVIDAVEKSIGGKINKKTTSRRAGDPPELIACAEKVKSVLGWQPKHDGLEEIVNSALNWERKLHTT